MKANESPERIYVCDDVFPSYVDWEGSPINTKRIDNRDIEYIRTDSFIEKACAWLKENGGSYWMDDCDLPIDELVKDFKNYMKGE